MLSEEEAFIQGIELAIDWNMHISEEDYQRYLQLVKKKAEENELQKKREELGEAIQELAAGIKTAMDEICESLKKFFESESVIQIIKAMSEMQQEKEENKEE